MEKHKSSNEQPPIEFTTPYTLEKCVSRIPSQFVTRISSDTYDFYVQADINNRRNQYINVYGWLQNYGDETTLVQGKVWISTTFYIFSVIVIPALGLLIGSFLNNTSLGIAAGIALAVLQIGFVIQKRSAAGKIFDTFKPIPKSTNQSDRFPGIMPFSIALNLQLDLPIQSCLSRVQELSFSLADYRLVQISEDRYWFSLSGLFGCWPGAQAQGTLTMDSAGTKVDCRIGVGWLGYAAVLLFCGMMGLFLYFNSLGMQILPLIALSFPVFLIGGTAFGMLTFRSAVRKLLLLTSELQ